MTPTPKRDAITRRIGKLREHGMVIEALCAIEQKRTKQLDDADNLLPADSPYRRQCNLCGVRGMCLHREPLVELAYAEVKARRRVT